MSPLSVNKPTISDRPFPAPMPVAAALILAMALAGCSRPAGSVEPTGDVPELGGWRTEVVAGGLAHPWAIAWLPDGSALITERAGRLRVLRDGKIDPTPIDGLPPICGNCGQGGLLDVSLHPDFADNRFVYLTYAAGDKDANRTALARGRLADGRLEDVEVIFENADSKSGTQHFGSRLVWLPDGTLLMSIGDGGNPPISFDGDVIRKQAQNLGTHFGSVVRLRDDGSVPPDNPFVGKPGAKPEIYSYGHRNIQGMVYDAGRDLIWANEHGSRGGDELNVIEPGRNYGWPEVTYSMEYWGPAISDKSSAPGVVEPKVVWTPSKAPSGLTVYTGERFPDWQGDLLSGALKFQELRRIDLKGNEIIDEEKLEIGQRVRDVRMGPDGELYVLTDENPGQLLRIVPK
jgi:glucose/arabinose dehydrogenase